MQVKDLRSVCAGLADVDAAVLVLTGDRAGERAFITFIAGDSLDSAEVVARYSSGDLEIMPNLRMVVLIDPAMK